MFNKEQQFAFLFRKQQKRRQYPQDLEHHPECEGPLRSASPVSRISRGYFAGELKAKRTQGREREENWAEIKAELGSGTLRPHRKGRGLFHCPEEANRRLREF